MSSNFNIFCLVKIKNHSSLLIYFLFYFFISTYFDKYLYNDDSYYECETRIVIDLDKVTLFEKKKIQFEIPFKN
jgi:hypothetical protein